MFNPKKIFYILIIFLQGCVVIPTYTAHISVNETSGIEPAVPMHNVLLIGTGPVASQVFLDNLSSVMIQTFENKGVHAEFSYIGKLHTSSTRKLDSLVNNKFDAYLIFKASDSSKLDMSKTKSAIIGPGIVGSHVGNQYAEKYRLLLYQKKEDMRLVWNGRLNIDFDLANDNRYQHISNIIFKALAKDGFQ
jgi:hypothetical protein